MPVLLVKQRISVSEPGTGLTGIIWAGAGNTCVSYMDKLTKWTTVANITEERTQML